MQLSGFPLSFQAKEKQLRAGCLKAKAPELLVKNKTVFWSKMRHQHEIKHTRLSAGRNAITRLDLLHFPGGQGSGGGLGVGPGYKSEGSEQAGTARGESTGRKVGVGKEKWLGVRNKARPLPP
jgi:hypothetical protein